MLNVCQATTHMFLFLQNQPLSNYGRPKGDGEVRVASVDKRAKQDRWDVRLTLRLAETLSDWLENCQSLYYFKLLETQPVCLVSKEKNK